MDTAQQQPEPGGPSNLAGAPAQDETQAREDDGRYGQAEGPGPIGAGLPDCGLIDEPVPGAEQEEAAQVGECLSKIEVKAQARQARRSTGSSCRMPPGTRSTRQPSNPRAFPEDPMEPREPDLGPVEDSATDLPPPHRPDDAAGGVENTWGAEPYVLSTRRPRLPRRSGPVVAGAVALVMAFGGGIALGRSDLLPSSDRPAPFATLNEAYRDLQDRYVDPKALDPQTLTYGAIRGLVDSVGDTGHTTFLSPKELAAQKSSLSGSVTGIGVRLSVVGGISVIQSVIPQGPASKAGLRSGDTIVAVDGTLLAGKNIDDISSLIRGQPGTTVHIRVGRAGVQAPLDFTITRAKVDVPAVSWAMVPGTTVADIFVEEFSQGATDQLKKAIDEARQAGANSLVLDLRQNPGGLA